VINDSAVAKEKLLSISEIDSETIKGMTDTQMFSFIQALNVTAAAFPLQKDELMHAFSETDYSTVFQWLEVIRSSLSQMHADHLATECEKFLKVNHDLSNIKPSRIKVFVDYFMPTLDIFITDVHQVLEDLEVEEVEAPNIDTSPVNVRDKILTLNDLDTDEISQMSDEELNDFLKILNNFHAVFNAQDNGLRNAMKIKHYAIVLQWLNAVEETLIKLHATDLVKDCQKQINISKDFNNIRHEKLEVSINYILSSMSMLSGDIKALHLPSELPHAKGKADTSTQINVDVEILSPGSSPESKTLLIINKMTMFMNSFKNALSDKEGHRLIGVTTAENAVAYLKTVKPDMFIIDEDLPGTDCYVLIKIIRATGQQAPIIFTASKIKQDKMAKYMEAGVAEFIMKPINPADVQQKVSKYLQ